MARLFSTQFPVDSSATLDEFLEAGKKWILGSPHASFKRGDLDKLVFHGEIIKSEGKTVELGRVNGEDYNTLGLAYTHPGEHGIDTWYTRVVGTKDDSKFWVGITVDYDSAVGKASIPHSRKPYVIKTLLEELGGGMDGEVLVKDRPYLLDFGQENRFADLILGHGENVLPIVYVSKDPRGFYLVNPDRLASALSGLSHVFVEPDKKFSLNLRDATRGANVFGGAIGVYWPEGLGRSFLLPRDYSNHEPKEIIQKTLDIIVKALQYTRLSRPLTWENIQSLNNQKQIEQIRTSNSQDTNTLLELYSQELGDKSSQIQSLENTVIALQSQLRKKPIVSDMSNFLVDPQVSQAYDEETKTVVIQELANALNGVPVRTRRHDIIEAVIQANPLGNERDAIVERVKRLFNGYNRLNAGMRKELNEMGFEIDEDGNHYKLTITADPKYIVVFPKTPSDHRSGKNTASDVIRTLF